MAVLTITGRSARIPAGPYWMQVFGVTTGAGQTDEYFVTGFNTVVAVIGDAILGDTPGADTSQYVMNSRGSADTEGDHPGDLGIETEAAFAMEITVLGS